MSGDAGSDVSAAVSSGDEADLFGESEEEEFLGFSVPETRTSSSTRRRTPRARTRGARSRPARRPAHQAGRDVSPHSPDLDSDSDQEPVSDSEWSEDPTAPVLPPFTGRPRLRVDLPTTILGFLQLFLTRELLEFLCEETNGYASYMRDEMLRHDKAPWVPVGVVEMAKFLGMTMMMGYVLLPDMRMYWQRSKPHSMAAFAEVMSRARFEAIRRYLHTFNRKAIPRNNRDKLIVIRPVMEYLQHLFKETYVPDRNLSLDEGLMPFKGRLSMKVYNPSKPHKYGVKMYMLCEASSGYVLDFITYAGLGSSLRTIVFSLMEPFLGQGYHVFMDNFYNSVSLAEELWDHGVICSGTLRLVRGAPPVLRQLAKRKQPRNSMQFRRKGNVFIICWQDVRLVSMITTAMNAETEAFVHRRRVRRGGQTILEEVELQRPKIIHMYTQYMGGVDLYDQMMQYYSFARKSKKWTRKYLMYLLQMAVLNAYTLFSKYHPTGPKVHLLDFMMTCVDHLLYFDITKWPSTGPSIARAPDLPVEERLDILPEHPLPSQEEDVDDPLPADAAVAVPAAAVAVPAAAVAVPPPSSSSPLSPPLPAVPSPSTSSAPPASLTPPAPTPRPATSAPRAASRRPASPVTPTEQPPLKRVKPDPECRLRQGNHHQMPVRDHPDSKGTLYKRCRVCLANGTRRDTRFCCALCGIPLCGHIRNCFQRYHTELRYWPVKEPQSGSRRPQATPQ